MEEASPYGFMLCAEVKKQTSGGGGVVYVEGIHRLARLKQSTQTEFFLPLVSGVLSFLTNHTFMALPVWLLLYLLVCYYLLLLLLVLGFCRKGEPARVAGRPSIRLFLLAASGGG